VTTNKPSCAATTSQIIPVEIAYQILASCSDVKSVIQASASCRLLRNIVADHHNRDRVGQFAREFLELPKSMCIGRGQHIFTLWHVAFLAECTAVDLSRAMDLAREHPCRASTVGLRKVMFEAEGRVRDVFSIGVGRSARAAYAAYSKAAQMLCRMSDDFGPRNDASFRRGDSSPSIWRPFPMFKAIVLHTRRIINVKRAIDLLMHQRCRGFERDDRKAEHCIRYVLNHTLKNNFDRTDELIGVLQDFHHRRYGNDAELCDSIDPNNLVNRAFTKSLNPNMKLVTDLIKRYPQLRQRMSPRSLAMAVRARSTI
jgi:hypothetical protein